MDKYESGGGMPVPPWLQEKQCKCQNCGIIFVGTAEALCNRCAGGIGEAVVKILDKQDGWKL